MLLGTLGDKEDKETIAISQGRGVVRAGERPIRAEQDFQGHLVFWLILKSKHIFKIDLNLMVFIQEIACLIASLV